ncbi:unnamed protein product [Moneuplotes crassus]|uniref:Uncharacterized protein n=1 Tax=Euplotes crassus TaxID=5936 RepID=A0AAD1U456_EUPCR|nr:unnamed protein product [Moneuplotes crassus]
MLDLQKRLTTKQNPIDLNLRIIKDFIRYYHKTKGKFSLILKCSIGIVQMIGASLGRSIMIRMFIHLSIFKVLYGCERRYHCLKISKVLLYALFLRTSIIVLLNICNDETALNCVALSFSIRIFLKMIEKTIKPNERDNNKQFNAIFNYETKVCWLFLSAKLILVGKLKVAIFDSNIDVDYQHSIDEDTVLHQTIKATKSKWVLTLYLMI